MDSTTGACVHESIPPVVPPTTWTGWFSVDDPADGTDDETLAAVRSTYPSVCVSPTQAECRVKFIRTDHVTAGQSLVSNCTPAAGLLCQNSDQPFQETCLDYEIRFECPTPGDTLPDPHFHWELSGKVNESDEDPISCGGPIVSIYPSKGGRRGVVKQTVPVSADSFNSSNHLCAHRNVEGYLLFGSAPNQCISEPSCCSSGLTATFWMRYRSVPSSLNRYIFSTGGQYPESRGFSIRMTRKFSFMVHGDINKKDWEMKMATPDLFPGDVWTHHCFTYNAADGTKYYKNGIWGFSLQTETSIGADHPENYDDVNMFTSTRGPLLYKPAGDFSDFKIFYRTFNDTEVETAYLRETSESNLVIHYLVETSTDDAFDVELECLAKSGSPPNITWYHSDDSAHFYPISPSSNVDIFESMPNNFRKRSELKIRYLNLTSDVIIACEALDVVGSRGSLSRSITIPNVTATGQPTTTQTTKQPTTIQTTEEETTRATTQIETVAADITSATLTTLDACSEGPVDTLQKVMRCIDETASELQDQEMNNLHDFLKIIPTLATQQLSTLDTCNATELILRVYSKLTDPSQNLSVEDHMSVLTDVEDAMEYLAGTLGKGNCVRADYETASSNVCHFSTLNIAEGYTYSYKVYEAVESVDEVIVYEEKFTFETPKEGRTNDSVKLVILRKEAVVQEKINFAALGIPEDTTSNLPQPESTSVQLNSALMSMSLFVNHTRRSIPVNFSLYHLQKVNDDFADTGAVNVTRKSVCAFWLEGTGVTNNRWSTSGCDVITEQWSSSFSACSCNHSTSFAVLMQVTEYKISEADLLALTWITYIGCSVSIIMLLLTLTIYAYVWGKLRSDRIFIHSSLSVAILIAQVLFMGGIERTENRVVCKVVALFLTFFYLSVFGWMLVEGIHLYKKVVVVYGSENNKMYPYLLVGWGIPAIITFVSFGISIEGYGTEKSCWLDTSSGLIWAFVGPSLIVIMLNVVVFVTVLRIIVKSAKLRNDKEHANIKAGIKGAVVLLPILGLTWVFGLLAVNSATIVFQYLFAIFNSFQGLFIFLNQCAFNSEVKEALRLRRRGNQKIALGTSDQTAPSSATKTTDFPAAVDDDVEAVEKADVDEEPVSNVPERKEPQEFYKQPPTNFYPLRRLQGNQVSPMMVDEK